MINNAGVFIAKPFTQLTADHYALITAVNLTGFFHITQRVIAQMLAQGDVGISSMRLPLWSNTLTSPFPLRWPRSRKVGLAAACLDVHIASHRFTL